MSKKFSKEWIAEQRVLAAKATPRPWKYNISGEWIEGDKQPLAQTWDKTEESFVNDVNNAKFIVTAANNFPAALDEIERLTTRAETAEDKVKLLERDFERVCDELNSEDGEE